MSTHNGPVEQISMSALNSMAMQVQCEQIAMAHERGIDPALIQSEYWLSQLVTETAQELQAKGVVITYD